MISGDSKDVKSRHAWFGSITGLGMRHNRQHTLMSFLQEMFFISYKYRVRHLNEKDLYY